MSKKQNRQVKTEFFRKRDGNWDKELKKNMFMMETIFGRSKCILLIMISTILLQIKILV